MRAYPLAVIVIAQLFGTSLWFSANSAGDDLMRAWALQAADIGRLTIAVQLGFILGTLGFALSGLADRFAASRIFAVCAVLGAAANAARMVNNVDWLRPIGLLDFLRDVGKHFSVNMMIQKESVAARLKGAWVVSRLAR